MAEVYYKNGGSKHLCFYHAVKAVMEKDERVTAYVDIEEFSSDDSYDSFVGFIPSCEICDEEY